MHAPAALLLTMTTTVAGTNPAHLPHATEIAAQALTAVHQVCAQATHHGPENAFAAALLAADLAAQALLELGYPPAPIGQPAAPITDADLDAGVDLALVTAWLLRQADERHPEPGGPRLCDAADLADAICHQLAPPLARP